MKKNHINIKQPSKHITTRRKGCKENENMVGERHRREPEDEAEKWRRRYKVWNILKKGDITTFIEWLHRWKPSITHSMVKRWNEGSVKIDGVDFMMME